MDRRLSRRTMFTVGGLAAVAAGGFLTLERVRPDVPPGDGPDLDNLPVAAVPEPTARPVEVVWCAGWDAAARTPVSPMSEAVARAQDAAGAQYAAVLYVGGVARAVVEVCWSARHAELWNVDDDGRRYRAVAYRRWPDGRLRLFEVRGWDHTRPDMPGIDRHDPVFSARVRRHESGAVDDVHIMAVETDGSTLQTSRDWADWPERRRPSENVALPAVDGWPALAGMTGPVTVRPGPDVVPDRFPWRPPEPLRPRHVTEMVTDGTRFTTKDGGVETIERVAADTVRLPTGRVLVVDPALLDADSLALADTVPPGEYPVDVFRLKEDGRTAAFRVTVTGAPVVSWHLALREGDQELALGAGEFFGNPVDAATLALVDAVGATAYSRGEIEDAMSGRDVYRTISDEKTGTDLVIVPGWGDGAYPVWVGRSADGAVSCLVLDYLLPVLAGARPA